MRCRICDKTFPASLIKDMNTRKACEDFKICASCRRNIIRGYTPQKNTGTHHTQCVICGRDIDHYNTAPTCQVGSCRQKWYQNQKDVKKFETYIETKDPELIHGTRVDTIHALGFEITLTKKESDKS